MQKNFAAVDHTLSHLYQVDYPDQVTSTFDMPPVPGGGPVFVQNVTAEIIAGRGDDLPVGAFPVDGTCRGTTRWEKRNIALEIPVWDPEICIQCGKCVLVCPHATIRAKVYARSTLTVRRRVQGPGLQEPRSARNEVHRPGRAGRLHRLRALRRCARPRTRASRTLKAINMAAAAPLRFTERDNWEFLPEPAGTDRTLIP